MSKSLVKLIDAALIPAAIMICGKVIGLWFSNTVFNLDWRIQTNPNDFFSVKIVYGTIGEQLTATTYSNVIMYLCVFIGFSIILARAVLFHSSHISPKILSRLASNNLLKLIADSFEIYHKASVWLVILWLAVLAVVVNVLLGKAHAWTALFTILCSVFSTVILLRDVANEITIAKSNPDTLTM
jgi:hypothetical protein